MSSGPLIPRLESFTARYWREDGAWLVQVVEEQSAHTFGASLEEARENILDVLATYLDCDVASVPPVRHVVELPEGADLSRVDDALTP